MSKHDHKHSCVCKHESVKYCSCCHVVYCLGCSREWKEQGYNWYYNYPNTWVYGNQSYSNTLTGAVATPAIAQTLTTTCSHKSK